MTGKIYLNNDLRGWGQNIFWELKKLGAIAQIVTNTKEILDAEGSTLFLNLHHHTEQLKKDLLLAKQTHSLCPRVIMTPTLFECELYNNKAKQHESFPGYFPPTLCLRNKSEAHKVVGRMKLPIIVKPSNQAGGMGVKIVHNQIESVQAIEKAFSDKPNSSVILQKYMSGNDGDYRVIVLANRYFWIGKRTAGDNGIVDGESIRRYGVKHYDILDKAAVEMMDYAWRFSSKYNFTRTAVDLIYDCDHKPIMTEITCSWGTGMMGGGWWYDRDSHGTYNRTKYKGLDQFPLIAQLLLDGMFQDIANLQIVERQ